MTISVSSRILEYASVHLPSSGKPKSDAIAGNLSKILPAVAQRRFVSANRRDLRDAFVDRVGRFEKVALPTVESAPLAAEHAFPHIAVVVAAAVETLLRAIIDARHSLARQQITDRLRRLSGNGLRVHKPAVRPRHLVVIIDESDKILPGFAVIGIFGLESLVARAQFRRMPKNL